jgi:hypothetical protein
LGALLLEGFVVSVRLRALVFVMIPWYQPTLRDPKNFGTMSPDFGMNRAGAFSILASSADLNSVSSL